MEVSDGRLVMMEGWVNRIDLKELNLNSIKKIAKEFDCSVGYSDHSIGHEAAIISVCMGARIIEKHFTDTKKRKGPDISASMDRTIGSFVFFSFSSKDFSNPEIPLLSLIHI